MELFKLWCTVQCRCAWLPSSVWGMGLWCLQIQHPRLRGPTVHSDEGACLSYILDFLVCVCVCVCVCIRVCDNAVMMGARAG